MPNCNDCIKAAFCKLYSQTAGCSEWQGISTIKNNNIIDTSKPLYHDLVLPTAYRCNTKKEAIQFIETISFRNKNQHVTLTRRDNKWVVSYFNFKEVE